MSIFNSLNILLVTQLTCVTMLLFSLCISSDELCEKEIEVDGEAATITLTDTWDTEVR